MSIMSRLRNSQVRKKPIWGPTRTVAALFFISIGLTSAAFAAPSQGIVSPQSRHFTQKPRKVPGRPGAFVKNYKLDAEMTRRAGNPNGVSRVIVTLVPCATLPAEFARYARRFGSDGAAGRRGWRAMTKRADSSGSTWGNVPIDVPRPTDSGTVNIPGSPPRIHAAGAARLLLVGVAPRRRG